LGHSRIRHASSTKPWEARIAERTTSMMGVTVPEVAFGYPKLALAEASRSL
jgi:hypothetical protein